MSDLKGKNIIVTGASGGIGNSIIEKLNQTGANILASGTRIEKLDELKRKFGNIITLKFDIAQSDKIEEFIENATKCKQKLQKDRKWKQIRRKCKQLLENA